MPRTRQKQRLGFSLVELMVVLVLVGTLVSLALPRFNTFIARGRQAEAHANLGIIASLQQSYKLEYNKYHGSPDPDFMEMGMGHPKKKCEPTSSYQKINTLGFRVTDCEKLRYTYTSRSAKDTAWNSGSNGLFGTTGYRAERSYIYPNCKKDDGARISKDRVLEHDTDVIEKCT